MFRADDNPNSSLSPDPSLLGRGVITTMGER